MKFHLNAIMFVKLKNECFMEQNSMSIIFLFGKKDCKIHTPENDSVANTLN